MHHKTRWKTKPILISFLDIFRFFTRFYLGWIYFLKDCNNEDLSSEQTPSNSPDEIRIIRKCRLLLMRNLRRVSVFNRHILLLISISGIRSVGFYDICRYIINIIISYRPPIMQVGQINLNRRLARMTQVFSSFISMFIMQLSLFY